LAECGQRAWILLYKSGVLVTKKSIRAYDLVIANHVALSFELITESDLKSILDAALLRAVEMKGA